MTAVFLVYNATSYVVKTRLNLIAALGARGYRVTVVSPADGAVAELARHGIAHIDLPMSQYSMSPFDAIRAIFVLWRLMRRHRPAVSLHYTIKPNTFGNIAARLAGVPVINNIAGAGRAFSTEGGLLNRVVKVLLRVALARAGRVLFQNRDDMRAFLADRLVAPRQARHIPGSGVDLARYAPLVGHGPDRTVFLFIGRLLHEKGIGEFLEAGAEVVRDDPDVRLHIVGEHGGTAADIDADVLARHAAHPQVTYFGAVTQDRIPGIIAGSTCIVLPSYYREGVPRSLLEACAAGRPIITTGSIGCRDVIEDGINGFEVAARDPAALAGAMRRFAALDAPERARMGAAARRKVEAEFDEKLVIDAYLEEIARLARQG